MRNPTNLSRQTTLNNTSDSMAGGPGRAMTNDDYTSSPTSYNDSASMRTTTPRPPQYDNYGRPINGSQDVFNDASSQYGRSSPAPSQYQQSNVGSGYGSNTPLRSASGPGYPHPSQQRGPPQRNMTAPLPQRQQSNDNLRNDSFRTDPGMPPRVGTAQSMRSAAGSSQGANPYQAFPGATGVYPGSGGSDADSMRGPPRNQSPAPYGGNGRPGPGPGGMQGYRS